MDETETPEATIRRYAAELEAISAITREFAQDQHCAYCMEPMTLEEFKSLGLGARRLEPLEYQRIALALLQREQLLKRWMSALRASLEKEPASIPEVFTDEHRMCKEKPAT